MLQSITHQNDLPAEINLDGLEHPPGRNTDRALIRAKSSSARKRRSDVRKIQQAKRRKEAHEAKQGRAAQKLLRAAKKRRAAKQWPLAGTRLSH